MKGYLVLESREVYEGLWHGGPQVANRAGEVVFNTSHSGYEEIATDPSYYSQIVLMTCPMQGNYGVSKTFWESRQLWIEGFLALQVQKTERDSSWLQRLKENKIPCLSELDTRSLTLRLREGGTPWGALVQAHSKEQALEIAQPLIEEKRKQDRDWVFAVSRKTSEKRSGQKTEKDQGKGPLLAVLDFGSKENIFRELERHTRELHIFPSRASVEEILKVRPDGLMLTNGPGDPSDVKVAVDTVKSLLGKIPIFGICMGHQILALALGAQTYKLKFGHRGSNHPIQDLLLQRVYVTSQNHGYAVEARTLPADVEVSQINLNDQTVAGIYSASKKCLGIQYHPESCPGPHEARGLFEFFINQMVGGK